MDEAQSFFNDAGGQAARGAGIAGGISFLLNYQIHDSDSSNIPAPKINVSPCYRAETQSRDCGDAIRYVQNRCTNIMQQNNPSAPPCPRQRPSDPSINRADAGNWNTAVSPNTIHHEIGHLLNLEDEYLDPRYPFNARGGRNSVMSSGNSLLPRHLRQMIAPKYCHTACGRRP